ncbi:MAG: hypothetical protein AB8H86_15875 [Polyangiales bacterium]
MRRRYSQPDHGPRLPWLRPRRERIRGASHDGAEDESQDVTETARRDAFPLCIAVVPRDDDASRTFTARVVLRDAGSVVASRELETGFVEGEIRVAELELIACTPGSCGPTQMRPPSSLLAFDTSTCSGDSSDAGMMDAAVEDTSGMSDAAAPDVGNADSGACTDDACWFSDIFDLPTDAFLRRGFFAEGALVLYGTSDSATHLTRAWPDTAPLGTYTAQAASGSLPTTPIAGGGGYFEDHACIALSTDEGPFTLLNGGSSVTEGTNNHLLVCQIGGEDTVVVERAGPTASGFAMGIRGTTLSFLSEDMPGRWFLEGRILGESVGRVSDLLVRGDGELRCASASFAETWTAYNTTPATAAVYAVRGEQDATASCSSGGDNLTQTYHFGGPGEEEVVSFFVRTSNVFVLVRHTSDLSLAIANGAANGTATGAGWTLLALSPSQLVWSATFDEPSSMQMLNDELVVASVESEDAGSMTRLTWYSLANEVIRSQVIDGAWSLVATESRAGFPQRLGFVSNGVDATVRVIVLRD